MYTIKPIIDSTVKLEGPLSTMYHMRNIYEQRTTINDSPISSAKLETTEMSALENRQLAMLEKLNELTNKVRLMAAKQLQAPAAAAQAAKAPSAASPAVGKKFNKCGKKAPAYILQRTLQIEKNGEGKPIDKSNLREIVINANPDQIPFSLRALKTLWMNRLNIHFQTFTHSSIAQLPIEARKFSESLKWSDVVDTAGVIPTLNIKLIWKNVKQTETISAATNYVPILGEVSVLRFLNRMGPSEFATAAYPLEASLTVDAALDIVAQLALAQLPAKNRAQLWKQLNVILGNKAFFGNELLTLADVAASSLVKQQTAAGDVSKAFAAHWDRVNVVVRYTE